MVTKWGLSEKLGPIKYDEESDEPFLGRSAGSKSTSVSDKTANLIDEESKKIIDTCYKKATKVLKDNLDKLHMMAESLVELETLTSDQIDDIMAGAKPRSNSDDDISSDKDNKKGEEPPIKDPAEQV